MDEPPGDTRETGGDPDWSDFFEPLDPAVVFECASTAFGRYDSVCVYRDVVVIESPDDPGSEPDIPVRRISAWHLDHRPDGARLTIVADRRHVALVPRQFARALAVALRTVLGSDPLRGTV
jgi:hypothetical protein